MPDLTGAHNPAMGHPVQAPRGGLMASASLSFVWVVAGIALPVGIVMATPTTAIDLAYLLAAGHRFLETGSIPRVEPFLAWSLGEPWQNQQWGAELFLGLAFEAGGWFALALARALAAAGFLAGVYLACRARKASRRRAALLTLGVGSVSWVTMTLRAQLLGMVCFAAVLWLVESRRQHPARLWLTLPVQLVWTNVHGSFPLGPALLGLATIEDRVDRRPEAGKMLLASVLAVAATFVGPLGPGVWHYAWSVATHPLMQDVVSEWQPPSLRTVPGALFLASGLIIAAVLARRGERAHPFTLLRLGLFFLLGLNSVRAIAWWAPVAAVELAPSPAPVAHPEASPRNRINTALIVLVVGLPMSLLARWLPYGESSRTPPHALLTHAPAGVTGALRGVLAPGERFFHAQAWGSWFELALPENPTTVDSRFEVMPPERWREYVAISGGRADWEDILDRWGVRVLALSRDQQAELIPIARRDPDWRLVYEDADGLVFVRN